MRMRLFLLLLSGLLSQFSAQNIILKNINIIPVNHEITIPGCNVFIRDGKIEKITPFPYVKEPGRRAKKKEPTAGYTMIDCEGGFLMPGMADMHAHFPEKEDALKLQDFLKLELASGVTFVRSMRGEKKQLAVRDSVSKGLKKNAPELIVSYVLNQSDSIIGRDSLQKLISYAKNSGFDFIKYLGGMKEKTFIDLSELCKMNRFPIAGHAYDNSLQRTMDAGFYSVEHYQPVLKASKLNPDHFRKQLDTLKTKRIGICPTLSFYKIYGFPFKEEELLNRNGMNYVSSKVKKEWQKQYNEDLNAAKENFKTDFESKYQIPSKKNLESFYPVLKSCADAGVLLLLSPDECAFNVPGFAMYEEMMLYKEAGLTNYQILRSATLNAAKCLQDNSWGSVEIGKKANLVLLEANPLEDLSNIKKVKAVILHGRYMLQSDLVKPTK